MNEPIVEKTRGISPIWLLPFLALCIGGWLLYQSIQSKGIEIQIEFKEVSGITAGKTMVMYKGLPLGSVKSMRVDRNVQSVYATVSIEPSAKNALVEDTKFWVVRPEVSADRIRGLETILSGSYITLQPGSSSKPSRNFVALEHPPPVAKNAPGLHLVLKAQELNSLQEGSGIYYRHIEIGSVQSFHLEGDDTVDLNVYIKEEYSHLVKEGSRFWNAGGINASASLSGIKVRIESLSALLRGGIVMQTPESLKNSPQVANNHVFKLYKNYETAEYGIPISLHLATGDGMVEGSTKIMYRGMQAGIVQKIEINDDPQHSVTARILLDPRAEIICREGTQFWLVQPAVSLFNISNLDTLLTGPYITFSVGNGSFQDHFTARNSPPSSIHLRPGSHFTLTNDNPASLSIGAPVLYKRVKIGEISDISLENMGESVAVTIFIFEEYTSLIKENSVFWNISGLNLRAGVGGVDLTVSSATSLLKGGIACLVPGDISSAKTAKPGTHFPIYDSFDAAVQENKTLQPEGFWVRIRANDLGSIQTDSPILYKQIPIGKVKRFELASNKKDVLIHCFIEAQYRDVISLRTRFYRQSGVAVKASLQDGISLQTGSLATMLAGGIGCVTLESPRKHKEPSLYNSLDEARLSEHASVTLYAEKSHGIQAGTPIRFAGITIGKVRSIGMDEPLQLLKIDLAIQKKHAELFRETSAVFLVSAELSLFGSKNLDTVISGPYLALHVGSGPLRKEFTLLTKPVLLQIPEGGLELTLESSQRGSLKPGSPVYYRQIQVGSVVQTSLSPDYQKVLVRIYIEREHRRLIQKTTKFWNVSGVKVDGGVFSGMQIETESLETIMTGGIALSTPLVRDDANPMEEITAGNRFPLYKKPDAEWLSWLENSTRK